MEAIWQRIAIKHQATQMSLNLNATHLCCTVVFTERLQREDSWGQGSNDCQNVILTSCQSVVLQNL